MYRNCAIKSQINSWLNLGHNCAVVSLLDIKWPNNHWRSPLVVSFSKSHFYSPFVHSYLYMCFLIVYRMFLKGQHSQNYLSIKKKELEVWFLVYILCTALDRFRYANHLQSTRREYAQNSVHWAIVEIRFSVAEQCSLECLKKFARMLWTRSGFISK